MTQITTLYFDRIIDQTDVDVLISLATHWTDEYGSGPAFDAREIWLPLSEITLDVPSKRVELPKWLAIDRGIHEFTTG